jgi:hypothetical protein
MTNDAFKSFAKRENLPAELTSAEWETIPSEIRQRAFFMARVTEAEILQRFRDGAEQVARNERDQATVRKEIGMWLGEKGYQPPQGKEGGLQDLSSLDRINVVLTTNLRMARGHAKWVRSQTGIRTTPAQEFYRLGNRMVPRDWETRWNEAKKETAGTPGVHPTLKIALLNHPIWVALSRFGQPWPPFDWGSGMSVKGVSRTRAKELGFQLDPNNDAMQKPLFRSMNDGLEVTPAIKDQDLREQIDKTMGRMVKWDGDKLIFTDPDGTKKYPAKELDALWKRPAPPEFDILTQKDALAKWKAGRAKEKIADRVTLRRLFDRIETESLPAQIFRAFKLAASDAAGFIRGLYAKRFTIPPDVAGWDFADSITAANKAIGLTGDGWKVLVAVRNGSKAVDVGALRPGKPGFVYVGGSEFKVALFSSDKGKRTINIMLEELTE